MADPQEDQSTVPDTTPQLDQAGASDTPGTPGPQQLPAQTAQQFPFPGGSGAPQGAPQGQPDANQPDAQKAPQQASQPQQPVAPKTDPAVEKASKVHSILQALSGGPHYATTIDPNTGVSKETQVPMSNGQYARSLAAAVLTGAFSGLGEKGPGAEGKAAEAGFNAALKQQQDQKAQEQLQATQTYARQAAIAHTNFQQHETAQRMGMLDYADHQQHVADNAKAIENVKAVGADIASNVHERDLLPKYNITQAGALIDGVEPRLNEDGTQAVDQYGQKLWDNTYTVVDPDKKIQLDQDTANYAAAHRIPGSFQTVDGKVVPKDFTGSPAVRAGIVLSIKAQTAAIQVTEAQLNQQLKRLGTAGDAIEGQLDANITKAIDKNLISPKALQTFSKYASMPFDQALDQMRKDKVDPSTIGQVSQLIPQDAQDALKKFRLDREASDKSARDTAAAVAKQKAELPGQIAETEGKAKATAKVNATYAYTDAFNRKKGELAAGGGATKGDVDAKAFFADDPAISALITPGNLSPDGINHKFLDAFTKKDPELAGLVMQILSGKNTSGAYGLAKGRGQMLDAAVAAASSEYNKASAEQYKKTTLDYGPSGHAGKAMKAGGTAFNHLANLTDAVDSFTTGALPGFKTFGDWFDSKKAGEFATGIGNVPQELGTLYANGGAAHEGDVATYRAAYSGNPDKVKSAIRQQAINAMDKMEADVDAYYASVPSTFIKPPTFLSAKSAADYTKITGLPVDPRLVVQSHKIGDMSGQGATDLSGANGGSGNQSQAAHAPVPGQRPNEIPQYVGGKLVGFSLPGKTGMRAVAPQQ